MLLLLLLLGFAGKEVDGTISVLNNLEEETNEASKLCFIWTISSMHLSIEFEDFMKEFWGVEYLRRYERKENVRDLRMRGE